MGVKLSSIFELLPWVISKIALVEALKKLKRHVPGRFVHK